MKRRVVAIFICALILFSFASCSAYRDVPHDVGKNSYPVEAYRTAMQYYEDFKVLQLTDLHLGIESDLAKQLDVVKNAIRVEEPDLIVLTGDNFMYASKGVVKSLIFTLNAECEDLTAKRNGRLTKFTVTFGNHDNQGDYSRYYINEVISSYSTADGNEIADCKYAAFVDFEDDNLFGLTNFYIDLVDDISKGRDSVDVKYRLHIIDSNTYHFNGSDYDYDIMHDEQLEHAIRVYEGATLDKSYIGMAFFHIPFHEYLNAHEQYESAVDPTLIGQGELREGVLHGYVDNEAYEKLKSANIVAFFCGHDHTNYGDYLYNASGDTSERAIFSYGVKTTNQLYHDTDMMGYKTLVLKDITVDEFLSVQNISDNFKNVTGGYEHYEN